MKRTTPLMDLLEVTLRRLMQAVVVGGLVIAAFLPARSNAHEEALKPFPARQDQTDEAVYADCTQQTRNDANDIYR